MLYNRLRNGPKHKNNLQVTKQNINAVLFTKFKMTYIN